jgi:hypothetical protein
LSGSWTTELLKAKMCEIINISWALASRLLYCTLKKLKPLVCSFWILTDWERIFQQIIQQLENTNKRKLEKINTELSIQTSEYENLVKYFQCIFFRSSPVQVEFEIEVTYEMFLAMKMSYTLSSIKQNFKFFDATENCQQISEKILRIYVI